MVINTGFIESIQFGCRTSIDMVRAATYGFLRPIACIGNGAFFVGTPAVNPAIHYQPICPGEPS
ncbi:hypothetical protein [Vreelandella arcis]|uniref:Uncharacterized protein n=1 Tax=Vreelandella arcis TaxID=416873 RepID=A0A1G9ZCX2_9GAMM|nr:hypothetical protein [Halomonas arcis]SDN19262.1 hypothetical protein SAMN04487951_10369 [Halomonas arcis]